MNTFKFMVKNLFLTLSVVIVAACSSGGSCNNSSSTKMIRSIEVTPTNPSYPVGTSQQFFATATYTDDTKSDITNMVTWSSSNENIATIESNGIATAQSAGTATITATYLGMSGISNLTVTPATLESIAVTPNNPSISSGATQQFYAIGIYSDHTSHDITNMVNWSSSNESVATIESNGLATAKSTGTATITATYQGISVASTLTITPATLESIAVTPIDPSIPSGTTQQFTATAYYSDGSTQNVTSLAVWSSSNESVATIESSGLATAQSVGTAAITATYQGISVASTLTITTATLESISITPIDPSIPSGATQQFTATGNYSDGSTRNITNVVTWSSSNESVATISNAITTSGLATAESAGTTIITAIYQGESSATTLTVASPALESITVTPIDPSESVGSTVQFTATANYSDGSTQDVTNLAVWSSSNESVATIESNGLATAILAGSTIITATYQGESRVSVLTVTAPILESITVTPASISESVGSTVQFTATANYSDGSTQNITNLVVWSSSNESVATIESTTGLATAISAGTATITATYLGESGTATLAVTTTAVVKYAYISNSSFSGGGVFFCKINTDGTLATCNNSGATSSASYDVKSARSVAFSGTHAYIASDGVYGGIILCNVSESTGQLSGCVDSGSGTLRNVMTVTTSGNYVYAVLYNAAPPSNIQVCQISSSNGLLSNCSTNALAISNTPSRVTAYNNHAYVLNSSTTSVSLCTIESTGQLDNCGVSGGESLPNGLLTMNIDKSNNYAYFTTTNWAYYCHVDPISGELSNCADTTSQFTYRNASSIDLYNGHAYSIWRGTFQGIVSCPANSDGTLGTCIQGQTFVNPMEVTIH